MICNTCGRNTQNEEANFCEYCGSSFRDHNKQEESSAYHQYSNPEINQAYKVPPMPPVIPAEQKEKPVSFLNWLGTYGIMLIPFFGSLAFFVMLFVWSFGKNVPESKKNWARATLVFVIVMLVLLVFFMAYMLNDPMFKDILSGNMSEIDQLYDELFNEIK